MTSPTKKPGGWSAVRQHLTTWDKPALLALVKDLYEAAAVNRDFIQARCTPGDSGGDVIEKYRHKIEPIVPIPDDRKSWGRPDTLHPVHRSVPPGHPFPIPPVRHRAPRTERTLLLHQEKIVPAGGDYV